jgi:hypothetical protein
LKKLMNKDKDKEVTEESTSEAWFIQPFGWIKFTKKINYIYSDTITKKYRR